jgi:hypothetical protein
MTLVPIRGSFVKSNKPKLTKEEYIKEMKKKGFHFDKETEEQK